MASGFKIGLAVFLAAGVWSFSAAGQMFGDETSGSAPAVAGQAPAKTPAASGWNNRERLNNWGRPAAAVDAMNSEVQKNGTEKNAAQSPAVRQNKPPAKVEVENPEDYIYKNVPQIRRPTLDGVKRGTVAIYPLAVGDDAEMKDETSIFLFYSDFTVNRMMSGTVTCNVKFLILTTLNRKLNNLSVRLRWPDMETALSFSDVPPNQTMHYNYTLIGDGCYSMDKIPNIIVNRCRVKGLSQKDCAAKVRWLRK